MHIYALYGSTIAAQQRTWSKCTVSSLLVFHFNYWLYDTVSVDNRENCDKETYTIEQKIHIRKHAEYTCR